MAQGEGEQTFVVVCLHGEQALVAAHGLLVLARVAVEVAQQLQRSSILGLQRERAAEVAFKGRKVLQLETRVRELDLQVCLAGGVGGGVAERLSCRLIFREGKVELGELSPSGPRFGAGLWHNLEKGLGFGVLARGKPFLSERQDARQQPLGIRHYFGLGGRDEGEPTPED